MIPMTFPLRYGWRTAAVAAAFALSTATFAQAPADAPATPPKPTEPKPAEARPADAKPADARPEVRAGDGPLAALAWLPGCYRGTANQREFREQWLPLRGDLLVGASHTVAQSRTQDFSHMRIEPRADGVFYVITPSRQAELAFRLTSQESEGPDRIFTFTSASTAFPQRIIYRRGTEGWLYVHVEGPVGGEERRVIYPMRRIDCESGDFLLQ